jgi:hypothetical protein
VTLLLGADETVHEAAGEVGRRFLDETTQYWHEWVRFLGIPFEWQEAVIRAAITLKLNAYDDTGAIIAAMTTSIPEAAGSSRNWDYRYCWLRDGYFVVNALNRLGATRSMERYLAYIINVAANAGDMPLQPVYGIDGRAELEEREVAALAGYRGMGPVRIGNLAYRQVQHDVYGSAILAATHIFFDQRLTRRGDEALFRRLEALGEQARRCYDQPDAGLWELRGSARVHTFSAVMCWAACDRLARIAGTPRPGRTGRLLVRPRLADACDDQPAGMEYAARRFRVDVRWQGDGCQPAAAGRSGLPRCRRSALCRHRRRSRKGPAPRRLHLPLCRKGRLRQAGKCLSGVHLLVCQCTCGAGSARGSPRAVRKAAGLPQSPRPAGGTHRYAQRRTMGQLRADLQHGGLINAAIRLSRRWDQAF